MVRIIVAVFYIFLNLVSLDRRTNYPNAGQAKTLPTEMRLGSYYYPGDELTTFPILPNLPRQAQ